MKKYYDEIKKIYTAEIEKFLPPKIDLDGKRKPIEIYELVGNIKERVSNK